MSERVTLRRPEPSRFMTHTSGFPRVPTPGLWATVIFVPSGENDDEPQVDAPWVNVCVIGCRPVPSGWTRYTLS